MKEKLLKTMRVLCVVALLGVGANGAWADGYKRIISSQDYETSGATDWTTNGSGSYKSNTGYSKDLYGDYYNQTLQGGGSGGRYAYKKVSLDYPIGSGYTNTDFTTLGYNIEFDILLKGATSANQSNQFIVPTTGPSLTTSTSSAYTGSDAYLFALSTTAEANQTKWYINDITQTGSEYVTLANDTWYHVKLIVTAASVSYTIWSNSSTKIADTQVKTGSLAGDNTNIPVLTGFFAYMGRSGGYFNFDNLEIYNYSLFPEITRAWGEDLSAVATNTGSEWDFKNDGTTLTKCIASGEGGNFFIPAYDGTNATTSTNIAFESWKSGTGTQRYWKFYNSGIKNLKTTVSIHIYNLTKGQIVKVRADRKFDCSGTLTALTTYDTGNTRYYQVNKTFSDTDYSGTCGILSIPEGSYIYSIDVFNPDPVSLAIADVRKCETSAAFANFINPKYESKEFSTAAEVYSTHTAWQIAQSKASGSTDITKVIRNAAVADATDWDGATVLSGEKYTGAPDNYYLDKNTGEIDASQTIYGLPAGKYVLKAATRASAGTEGTIYVWADGLSLVSTAINADGNTGGTLDHGWSWTEREFEITETKDIHIGFWADVDGKWASCDDFHLTVAGATTSITSAGWATLYTPYALDFSGTGLTAYTATVSENTVTLNPVENVPANTGVVLKGDEGNYSIPVIASSSTEKGSLIGSATDATACPAGSGTYYILTKVGDKAQFNPATSGSIAAGKAFLHVGGSARTLSVVFADETTGVSDATRLKNNEESIKNGEVYNLAGQRVSQPTKGLYIVNGMKVSIK